MGQEEWATSKKAKKCGTGAHILVPKKFKGRKFRVKLLGEDND